MNPCYAKDLYLYLYMYFSLCNFSILCKSVVSHFHELFCSDFINTLNSAIALSFTLIFTAYLNIPDLQIFLKKEKIFILKILYPTFRSLFFSWISNKPKSKTSQPGSCQLFFFSFWLQ